MVSFSSKAPLSFPFHVLICWETASSQMIGSDCANVVNLPLFQQHLQVNTGELVVEVQLVGGVVWNDA